MHGTRFTRPVLFSFAFAILAIRSLPAATPPSAAEAQQLQIIKTMSDQLRARIDQLPVLIPASHPLDKIEERLVTLNRTSVVVEGQRFDGVVVVAPEAKASFGWAFVSPANAASWYIFREKGDMKGFADFLRRTRAQVPLAAAMKPETGANVTFQKLDSAQWQPGERYILWFRFTNDTPAEFTIRAGFFARPSLNGNALPSLIFPAPVK
jgi:hypothetical protein